MKNVWSLVGAIAALLAVGVSLILFFHGQSQQEKKLEVTLISQANLLNPDIKRTGGKLSIFYDGRPINNYSVLQFKVENVGGQPIRKGDYDESLRIALDGVAEIVSTEIVYANPRDLGVAAKWVGSSVEIANVLLNPTDQFIIEVGTIPQGNRPPAVNRVDGRIAGLKRINYIATRGEEVGKGTREIFSRTYLTALIIMQITLTFTFIFQRWWRHRRAY